MADKPVIKVGHLKITDHLILGVTDLKLKKGKETFDYCSMEPVLKTGWNEVADDLTSGNIQGAFILAPTAMDLFKSGVGIKLILFTHKSGSILVKNKAANIEKIEDFAGKAVLIPYQLSIHNMLFHKLLAEKGLKPGTGKDVDADVLLEVMAPARMPEAPHYKGCLFLLQRIRGTGSHPRRGPPLCTAGGIDQDNPRLSIHYWKEGKQQHGPITGRGFGPDRQALPHPRN